MKIGIVGAGNMATAFATLCPKDSDVKIYSIEKEVADEINNHHTNLKYSRAVLGSNVSASLDIKECIENADITVLSVPSSAVRSVCEKMKPIASKKSVIILLSKGFEEKSKKTLSQVVKEYLKNEIVFVAGPSIANEVAEKKMTFVVFASKGNAALKCRQVFEKEYYKISVSNDILGCELCSFLKNAYAINLGIASGLDYGMNAKAAIISNSLEEMSVVCKKLGAKKESAYSLAGIGDLIVTSLSSEGRNKRFGELIAKGKTISEAKEIIGQVVEGEESLKALRIISDKKRLNLPVFEKTYSAVFLGKEAGF